MKTGIAIRGAAAALLAVFLLSSCGRRESGLAVVDVDAVFKGYKRSQAIYAELDKERKELETKGQGMLDEINTLVKESEILSEEARKERESRIREKSAAVELFRRTASRNLMDRTTAEYGKLMTEIRGAAEAVARKKGIPVVLDASTTAYHEKGLDMTAEIVEELNRRFDKAGGGK